ncbi:hypothetical protein TYRP_015653 [Tyrophagus putrescentiae]|nr:hypothetical protein TYRP_015653 [Tyrophagus putrescentiae]
MKPPPIEPLMGGISSKASVVHELLDRRRWRLVLMVVVLMRTGAGAVEEPLLAVVLVEVDAVVAAGDAVVGARAPTAATLVAALHADVPLLVGKVIARTVVLALLAGAVVQAGADGGVEAKGGAVLAAVVALPANGLTGQRLEGALLLRPQVLVVEALRAVLLRLQALLHHIRVEHRDDRLLAAVAAARAQPIPRSGAAEDAVLMAAAALPLRRVLRDGALADAVGAVADVLAAGAGVRAGPVAAAVALLVAVLAHLIAGVVDSKRVGKKKMKDVSEKKKLVI